MKVEVSILNERDGYVYSVLVLLLTIHTHPNQTNEQEVYAKCIGSNEAQISTLQMLTKLERRMEELFESIDDMPKDYVQTAEKQKEKERRQRLRSEKLEMQKKAQSERIQRALERSKAPTIKKVCKNIYRTEDRIEIEKR